MLIIVGMKYPIVTYCFLGLFLVASIVQLVLAFTENQKLRRREKFLCLLTLGLAAVFAVPNQPLIYIATFLGMTGDILVLRKKTFNLGATMFFFGHICYLLECIFFVIGTENIGIEQIISFIAPFIIIALIIFLFCKKDAKHSTKEAIYQGVYFAILIVYIPVFTFAMSIIGSFMYLSLIGSIIFIISDTILVVTHFGYKFKRYDFYIMLTYLLAEFLIISGLVLTLIR